MGHLCSEVQLGYSLYRNQIARSPVKWLTVFPGGLNLQLLHKPSSTCLLNVGTYIWDSYKIWKAVISYTIFMNNDKTLPAGVCKVV